MRTIGEAFVKIRADLSQFQTDVNGAFDSIDRLTGPLSQKLSGLGDTFGRIGGDLTRRVTLPLAGAGAAAFKTATDFETSFAQIEGLVGVAGTDLDTLREAALELGPQYGKSANEAAEALFFITSAGLRGTDAVDTLDASLRASATGLGDVATIADLATSVVNAYGSETTNASQATDILTAAVREGKLAPEELAGSIGSVLPLASAMGVNFDEVGAAFAAMSRTGTNASEASTQLRGIMTALLKPTVQAEEALEGMGLSSEGLRQQIKDEGLLSVLETLSSEFEGNDEAAAQVFGNVRALSGVLDLMGSNADGTRQIFDAMADTTGTLDDAFSVVSETSAFEMQQAMAEMKLQFLEIGNIVMPFARDLIARFREIVESFRNLTTEQKEMVVRFAAIAAAAGPVLIVLGKVLKVVSGVVKVIGGLAKGITLVAKAFVFAAKTALPPLIKGIVLLTKAMFANPIGLIVVGIAALIAGLVLAYRRFEGFRNVVDSVFAVVKDIVQGFVDFFVSVWDIIKVAAEAVWPVIQTVIQTVVDVLTTAFDIYRAYVIAVWEAIQAAVEFVWPIIQTVVETVISVLSTAFEVYKTYVEGVWTAIKVAAEIAFGLIQTAFDALKTGLEVAIGIVQTVVQGVWDALQSGAETAFGLIKGSFEALKTGITTAIEIAKTTVSGVWTALQTGAETAFGVITTAWETLTGGIETAIETAKGVVTTAFDAIKLAGETIFEGLGGTISGAFSAAVSGIKNIINPIIRGTNTLIRGVNRLNPFGDIPEIKELANGGIVAGATLAMVGEAGAEAVIPLTRPARAMQLMEQSGLAAMARANGGAAVNIQSATFVAPVDAELVAQKVLVAEKTRAFAA